MSYMCLSDSLINRPIRDKLDYFNWFRLYKFLLNNNVLISTIKNFD